MEKNNRTNRYPELDALRGIAVLMMIGYHVAFDLAFFYGWNIPVFTGGWRLLAQGTAMLFLIVVGICFMISWERQRVMLRRREPTILRDAPSLYSEAPQNDKALDVSKYITFSHLYPKYFQRGITIFAGGMIISIITWILAPNAFVKFGILHLIGVSALLQPFFTNLKTWNVLCGFMVTMIGMYLTKLHTESMFLFPLGLPYPHFASLDYYPIFPWFGFILTGMGITSFFYVPERSTVLQKLDAIPYPKSLLQIGKSAFLVYFLHQPILLIILYLLLGKPSF